MSRNKRNRRQTIRTEQPMNIGSASLPDLGIFIERPTPEIRPKLHKMEPAQREAYAQLDMLRRRLPKGHMGFSTQFVGNGTAKMAVDGPDGRYWVSVTVPDRRSEAIDAEIKRFSTEYRRTHRPAVRPMKALGVSPSAMKWLDKDDEPTFHGIPLDDMTKDDIEDLSPEDLADLIELLDSDFGRDGVQ